MKKGKPDHKPERRVPAILSKPLIWPDSGVPTAANVWAQWEERIKAACGYYKINPKAADRLRRLVLVLLKERFPSGFTIAPHGRNTLAGNKKKWKFQEQIELATFICGRKAKGDTQREAAEKYAKKVGQATGNIVTRFHEAKTELKKLGFTSLQGVDL